MDQGKGDEEDLAARYFEFAQQFLTLSNEETDGLGVYMTLKEAA
jgi:hypothetical protein